MFLDSSSALAGGEVRLTTARVVASEVHPICKYQAIDVGQNAHQSSLKLEPCLNPCLYRQSGIPLHGVECIQGSLSGSQPGITGQLRCHQPRDHWAHTDSDAPRRRRVVCSDGGETTCHFCSHVSPPGPGVHTICCLR